MFQIKSISPSFRDKLPRPDLTVCVCAVILSIYSLLMLYGIRETMTLKLFRMQLLTSGVGIAAMLIITSINYEWIARRLWLVMMIGQIVVLAATLIYGKAKGENQSWLKLGGITLQPSEFVKFSFILTFSVHLDRVKDRINSPLALLGLAAHAGVVVGLILLSGDLGVALVYIGIIAIMLYCCGLSVFYFLGAALALFIAIPTIWPFLRADQQERIIYGFNPEGDPLGKGMQPLRGRAAVAAGGFFGKGIDGGTVWRTLYARENDFAFSTLCEKFGMFGGIIVIVALVVLVVRVFIIARGAQKDLGAFICVGVAAALTIQTIENIGMCLAMLPVIGITLPFISYGGSATLSMYMLMGLVQSVRMHKKKYFFDHSPEP